MSKTIYLGLVKNCPKPCHCPSAPNTKNSNVNILQVMMDAIMGAGEDLSKFEKGSSNESWALAFVMNIAQAEFSVLCLSLFLTPPLTPPL
jgi:hypothetical protein